MSRIFAELKLRLGKAVARRRTLCTASGNQRIYRKAYLPRNDEEEQSVMSRIFAELKLRLGKANTRSRTCRTASGV